MSNICFFSNKPNTVPDMVSYQVIRCPLRLIYQVFSIVCVQSI